MRRRSSAPGRDHHGRASRRRERPQLDQAQCPRSGQERGTTKRRSGTSVAGPSCMPRSTRSRSRRPARRSLRTARDHRPGCPGGIYRAARLIASFTRRQPRRHHASLASRGVCQCKQYPEGPRPHDRTCPARMSEPGSESGSEPEQDGSDITLARGSDNFRRLALPHLSEQTSARAWLSGDGQKIPPHWTHSLAMVPCRLPVDSCP